MNKLQPENNIVEEDGEAYCLVCGELLEPVYENEGFNEPGAEHYEVIGYKNCNHGGDK